MKNEIRIKASPNFSLKKGGGEGDISEKCEIHPTKNETTYILAHTSLFLF